MVEKFRLIIFLLILIGTSVAFVLFLAYKKLPRSYFSLLFVALTIGPFVALGIFLACDNNNGYCRNWQICFTNCPPVSPLIGAELLSTDMHVSVAQHTLVLPFIATGRYTHRKRDSKLALDEVNRLLRDSADPEKPLLFDKGLHVTLSQTSAAWSIWEACPLLTREWAQSVCKNPWSAIKQALPSSFELVDLRRLQVENPRAWVNRCRNNDKPRQPLPQSSGEAVMVCEAQVYGGRDGQYHTAVVRIDDDLSALWIVWRPYRQDGETAEVKTEREGKAIVAFVQYALGESENFPELLAAMCRLRRPGSVDDPRGSSDCERATLPMSRRNQ